MLSIPKILLVVLLAVVLFKGWKWVQRWQARQKSDNPVQETERCRVCDAYVPTGTTNVTCDFRGCPYRNQ